MNLKRFMLLQKITAIPFVLFIIAFAGADIYQHQRGDIVAVFIGVFASAMLYSNLQHYMLHIPWNKTFLFYTDEEEEEEGEDK